MKVLLGITGSVAAKLTYKIADSIVDAGHMVNIIYTNSAFHFTPRAMYGGYDDDDEWEYYHEHKKVLHIDLVKGADKFVIAPCTANTLAKIANGICDNLLTCCVRAWPKDKTSNIILAPAMNTEMWNNHVTQEHIKKIEHRFEIVPPQYKELFCGDTGVGAMAQIEDIIKIL